MKKAFILRATSKICASFTFATDTRNQFSNSITRSSTGGPPAAWSPEGIGAKNVAGSMMIPSFSASNRHTSTPGMPPYGWRTKAKYPPLVCTVHFGVVWVAVMSVMSDGSSASRKMMCLRAKAEAVSRRWGRRSDKSEECDRASWTALGGQI